MGSLKTKINNFKKVIKHVGFKRAVGHSIIYILYYRKKAKILRAAQKRKQKIFKIQLFNKKNFFISSNDTGLSFDLMMAKIREPIATKKIIEILSKEKKGVFLDIGANLGYYTIILQDMFKKIVCLEPNKKAITLLEKNIDLNKISKKTKIIEGAINISKKPLHMLEKEEFNLSQVSPDAGDYQIKSFTLNDMLKKGDVSFMKMDVEGFEYALFNKETLKLKKVFPKHIFIELHHEKASYQENKDLLLLFDKLGYKIAYAIWEMKGPHYLSYRFKQWKKYSHMVKKLLIGEKNQILAEDMDISTFIQNHKDVLNGQLFALEFIFEKKT